MEQEILEHEKELIKMTQERNTQFVISRSERPNSYEFGKAGNRFKLYFDTPEDLDAQIKRLITLGLYASEEDI